MGSPEPAIRYRTRVMLREWVRNSREFGWIGFCVPLACRMAASTARPGPKAAHAQRHE
jgi:hypothetical protein